MLKNLIKITAVNIIFVLCVALCLAGRGLADDEFAKFMHKLENSYVMVESYDASHTLEYSVDKNELRLVRYTAQGNDVAIPGKIGLLSVTAIGEGVFSEQVMQEITLPCHCFYTNVLIQQPLVSLLQSPHEVGFSRDVPRRVDSFRDTSPFESYALKNIILPDTLRTIEAGAFLNCRHLTNITLSATLESIGKSAFSGNIKLQHVKLPQTLKTIGHSAFSYCTALSEIIIPDHVTTLEPRTFHGCCNLRSITIGKGVSSVFQGDVINVTPAATKFSQTLWHCCNLTNISVHPENPYYRSVEGVLYTADMRELILCPAGKKGRLKIPSGVSKIHRSAFAGSRLRSLSIPVSVVEIGSEAFEYADIEDGIHLPSRLTTIREALFLHTQSNNITLGNQVRIIEEDAFAYSTALWQVELPETLIAIGDRAFAHCSNLHIMEIPPSVTDIGDNVFYGCTKLRIKQRGLEKQAQDYMYAPDERGIVLTKHYGWGGDLVVSDKVGELPLTAIGNKAFCEVEEKVIEEFACQEGCCLDTERALYPHISAIQDAETIIAATAVYFDRYDPYFNKELKSDFGLRSVVLPDTITDIDQGAFMNCSFLTNITLSASLQHIGAHAFSGCEQMTKIELPDNLKTIGHSAFSYCTSLQEITIPDQVSELLPRTFVSCRSMRSITIGKGVSRIMQGNLMPVDDIEAKMSQTFWHCCNLANITVHPENRWYCSIDGVLFTADMCELILCPTSKRGELVIPAGVEKIHNSAFAGSRLSRLIIPGSVVEIGIEVFEDAKILETIHEFPRME